MNSLISPDTFIKVSSTLDKSVGKKNLIDGSPETCWTSQQGLPQFIQLTFPTKVIPKRISVTFQGGFVGTQCSIYVPDSTTDKTTAETPRQDWRLFTSIYPEDVNRAQSFDLDGASLEKENGVGSLKLVFDRSSDFFGRIVVYDLRLEGSVIVP